MMLNSRAATSPLARSAITARANTIPAPPLKPCSRRAHDEDLHGGGDRAQQPADRAQHGPTMSSFAGPCVGQRSDDQLAHAESAMKVASVSCTLVSDVSSAPRHRRQRRKVHVGGPGERSPRVGPERTTWGGESLVSRENPTGADTCEFRWSQRRLSAWTLGRPIRNCRPRCGCTSTTTTSTSVSNGADPNTPFAPTVRTWPVCSVSCAAIGPTRCWRTGSAGVARLARGAGGGGYGSATLARRTSSAKGFTAWAERTGRMPVDPGIRLVAPKAHRTLPPVLRQEQAAEAMVAAESGAAQEDPWPYGPLDRRVAVLDRDPRRRAVRARSRRHRSRSASARVLGKGDKERVVPFGRPAEDAIGAWLRSGRPDW